MTDTLKITTFAGHPVPADGLTVHPPQGGELTVWPDGGYAFVPPEGGVVVDGQAPVTTYYSFVMEDVDGETSVGTFSLTPGDEMPPVMEDFHAWSLPDLLQDDSGVAQLLLDAEVAAGPIFDGDVVHAAVDSGIPDVVGGDSLIDDDLTQLILTSQNS